ncbi:MAG TPA: glycoside hydrolase family 43 protein [Tepidisphaeraceae bacterium]
MSQPLFPRVDLSKIRNPVIPGWYADPELRLHDGRFYLFPTYSDEFAKQTFFDAFVSDDLVNWTKMDRVLELRHVGWSSGSAAWAPSVISRYGTMFMYFSSGDGDGIGLGVWNRFQRKFVDALRRPLVGAWPFGAQPIDANVFVDDDGEAYLYFGGHSRCVGVKLKPDMNQLNGEFRLLTPDNYVEGPFMFKRQGRYYFMWSEGEWVDHSYGVAYAIAESPWGPFHRIDAILSGDPTLGTGAGHNSVLHIPGTDDWVICYHRRPAGETDRNHRVTCIDRLTFRPDGTIAPVVIT